MKETYKLTIGAYYLAPYASTPEHVRDLAQCGIDVVVNMRNDRAALDLLAQNGVSAIVSGIVPGWFGGDGSNAGTMSEKNPLEKYEVAAERFEDHPAIIGIDAGDEPSSLDFGHYGRAINAIHKFFPGKFAYLGPVVRKDWLDECSLAVPTTISEFENVIRVFNEKYGAKFSFAMSRFQYNGLAGAFGAYGTSNAGWSWFVKDGKVGLGQVQPEFRNYLSWLNMLWDEGLMDQDVITLDDTSIKGKVHNDQIGISVTSMGQMNNWNNERVAKGQEPVWVGIPYPKADDGSLSSVMGGFGIGSYTGVITKTADEETMKLCLQMLDYAYTQEGFLYFNYGNEGVSWTMGADGIPQFTELVTADTDTEPMRKYNGMTYGGTGIQATNLLYLKNAPAAIEANNTWFYNFEDEQQNLAVTGGWRWPVGVTFTVDEMDMINIYGGSIGTYITESFQAFLTGTMDVDDDATWEKYLKDAETYNLSKILQIRQDCYVLCASFTENSALVSNQGILFWPKGFTAGSYKMAFEHPLILSGYKNILIVLGVSLPLNIFMTLFCGYFLACKGMMFKKPVMFMIMFTMFFGGGMIPAYLNIRDLGLYNSLWALILPGMISVYNCIICRTAIEGVPESLKESAYLDGANDLVIVFKIILPLIMPTIAVLLLYYGVGHWNAWFNASIYLQDNELLPIQNIMRSILIANSNILNASAAENDQVNEFAESIKYATIILTTVPVLCIYPFLQKYFVKGVMVGAVKG